jgi:hypothetical protein
MADSNPHRYRAFISYSQQDKQHAKRLHSALETYRVPKGIDAPLQPNRRLGRFFRDDDEMGASTDLGGTLRDALENSENLIVICSPHSARSKWVNAEILHFKSVGRGDRIFAVVVDGMPNSDDSELRCFPPAFGSEVVSDELLAKGRAEPLGIDLRKEPFPRARIRLVAGLLAVPFDSLWQREKRRTIKRRAIAAAASLALLFVIGLLGTRWLAERGRVRAQIINRTMETVRDDLASERVQNALAELERLNADGEQGAVEEVLKMTLSWVTTPTELLKEIKPPVFVTDGARLFFLAADGSRHLLNIQQPFRRILSSDRRSLLIFGADEVVAINVADGREVSRINSNKTDWIGHTFETRGGLLIVGGRFYGLTNGSLRDSLLVFSRQRQTLSLFNLNDYWQDDENPPRFISPMAVSPDCRSFGVARGLLEPGTAMSIVDTDIHTLTESSNGLKPTTISDLTDWTEVSILPELDAGDSISYGPGNFDARCTAPASDSADPNTKPGVTGLFRPVGFGTAWEPEKRWKVIGDAKTRDGERVVSKPDENRLCTDEHPCPIQDPEWADEKEAFGGVPYYFKPPRGVSEDDRSFDLVNNEKVHVFEQISNGGSGMEWCRKLNSKVVCLHQFSTFDPSYNVLEGQKEIYARSATGRFIFHGQGEVAGFRLFDLSTMRNVTPHGPELVASTQWADFSPSDKRLFLALNGRLLVFEPQSDGSPWKLVNDGRSVQIPALSGNKDKKDDRVAGLLSLNDDNLLVVRSSGVISRFDWHTGQQIWGRSIGSVGEITRVVISRNRRFALLIGRGGGRLLDTRDGLVISGVLVPPSAMDGTNEMLPCFDGAFVSDMGAIDVSCGEKEYRREHNTFTGDVRSRLRAILSEQ